MAAERRKDRTQDIERLAAELFAGLFATTTGTAPAGLAKRAIQAAREFWSMVDEPVKEPRDGN